MSYSKHAAAHHLHVVTNATQSQLEFAWTWKAQKLQRICCSAFHTWHQTTLKYYTVLQLQGSGVNVSISFPADMNTPCYEQETLIKV